VTDPVRPPPSVTDPYAPEPSETQRVCCVLHYADGRVGVHVTDARVLGQHTLLRIGDAIFDHRGDSELSIHGRKPRWCKIFRQCLVVDLEASASTSTSTATPVQEKTP
jgi:hypothetical protein